MPESLWANPYNVPESDGAWQRVALAIELSRRARPPEQFTHFEAGGPAYIHTCDGDLVPVPVITDASLRCEKEEPPRQREVQQAVEVDGLTQKQAAALLNVSQHTVLNYMRRIRAGREATRGSEASEEQGA